MFVVKNERNWFGLRKNPGPRAGEHLPEASGPGSPGGPGHGSPEGPKAPAGGAAAEASASEGPGELSAEEQNLATALVEAIADQCDFLLRAAPPETHKTDAPAVIDSLRRLDNTVIRQPPVAAQRALSVARDPVSNSAQVAHIFEQDPALTRALLQTANSSYYHRGQDPCLAINEAIQQVGVRGVESIVTMNMIEGLLCRPGSAYTPMMNKVWSHMTRTAPIARGIAPAFGIQPETAFTVGLLHDVGKLVIFDYMSRLRTSERREIQVPDRFLLNMLNWLHEPLGGIAALRWKLGHATARSISVHHHHPTPETPDPLAELLCVAERVDHAIRLRAPLDSRKLWRQCRMTTDLSTVLPRLKNLPDLELDDGSSGVLPRAA